MTTRLFLIRHGETAWSRSGQHTGHTDLPLTDIGQRQARLLSARLQPFTFTHAFTSPLQRAEQTCRLAGFSSTATVTSDLSEWDYGDYESLHTVDILRGRPGWNLFADGAPNGESPGQIAARADHFLSIIRPLHGDVIAFSSGHIIRVLAARWLGLAAINGAGFSTGTTSINILGHEHPGGPPAVLLWNDGYLALSSSRSELP